MSVRELGNGLGNALALPRGGVIRGEVTFTVPSTVQWAVPAGIASICAVVVGGGAGGGLSSAKVMKGGSGGALSWVNNIAVNAGDILTIIVGVGGYASSSVADGGSGGDSSISLNGNIICKAGGGTSIAGGSVIVGDGGGAGGVGGIVPTSSYNYMSVGGGGAGGYSGNGGDGGAHTTTSSTAVSGTSGTGGAGGGGAALGYTYTIYGHGGGVGIYGEGVSGTGGTGGAYNGGYGSGTVTSSGDNTGQSSVPTHTGAGGGASHNLMNPRCASVGGSGAVRIIWGEGRAFPSTDCGQS